MKKPNLIKRNPEMFGVMRSVSVHRFATSHVSSIPSLRWQNVLKRYRNHVRSAGSLFRLAEVKAERLRSQGPRGAPGRGALRAAPGCKWLRAPKSVTLSQAQIGQVTLSDCLACSGCVTSAETVLLSLRSHLNRVPGCSWPAESLRCLLLENAETRECPLLGPPRLRVATGLGPLAVGHGPGKGPS